MLGSLRVCQLYVLLHFNIYAVASEIPIVINTWHFPDANVKAWEVLRKDGTALDAVEQGASQCEILQCDGTVGYGGSPDEFGETRLDALIMDGKNMNVGAVGSMKRIKNAIAVARHVLDHTKHSILVGEAATKFAIQMGFKEETLSTTKSKDMWKKWYNSDHCQPNFWVNVHPDPKSSCGPYSPEKFVRKQRVHSNTKINKYNHDTIGMIAIDKNGDIAAGTSTNGAKFKIPGRVGDSPIPGSGAYADNSVGGAAGTGDGDIMLRFSPSFFAVEEMRRGVNPTDAARAAVKKIAQHYPNFSGAVIALTKDGQHGAACNNIDTFPYVVSNINSVSYRIVNITCDMPPKLEL